MPTRGFISSANTFHLRLARCCSQLFKLGETEDTLREVESILAGGALVRDYLLRAQLELARAWLHWRRRSLVRAAEASRELELARKCLDKAEAQLIGHSHPAEASQLLTLRGKLQEAVFQEKRRPKPLSLLSDAKTYHYRALSLAAKASWRYGVVIAQYNIAWSHYLTSQYVPQPSAQKEELEVARTWCESCIDYASRGQAGLETSFAKVLLAGIYWRLGDCAKARGYAEQALNAAETLGNRHEQALAHLALARVAIDDTASSDPSSWEQHLRKVEAISQELNHRLLSEMANRERKRATQRGARTRPC